MTRCCRGGLLLFDFQRARAHYVRGHESSSVLFRVVTLLSGARRYGFTPRYDYRCKSRDCRHEVELLLPISSEPSALLPCPSCGKKKLGRVIENVDGVTLATAAIGYQNRFPYVSTAFPFKAKGAKHVGPLGKCLIESKSHEAAMRREHGYVGG